jgi:hypothetical protein
MKRPTIITIICIIGYLSVLFTFPQVFSPSVKKLGMLMPALFGVLVASHFIACVGVWYFKQWGVQLYLFSFFARTLFYMGTDQTGFMFYFGGIISVASVFFLVKHYPKMNPNL